MAIGVKPEFMLGSFLELLSQGSTSNGYNLSSTHHFEAIQVALEILFQELSNDISYALF